MNDAVDPFHILEDTSPELEKTLEDPLSMNFRGRERDLVELYPDHLSFRQATVDLGNQNVELQTNLQSETEGYTTVMYTDGAALVESQAEIRKDNRFGLSTAYYLVTDQHTLIHNGHNWEETYNPGVRDAAHLTPHLYQKAQNYTGSGKEETIEQSKGRTVPPPRNGDFTE
ncbi:MAG: hypothetical protein ABEK16_04100 [Candidatus Nanohalobium sp.]